MCKYESFICHHYVTVLGLVHTVLRSPFHGICWDAAKKQVPGQSPGKIEKVQRGWSGDSVTVSAGHLSLRYPDGYREAESITLCERLFIRVFKFILRGSVVCLLRKESCSDNCVTN